MRALSIRIDDIQIGDRHRAISDDAVARLARSIGDIGLRQPISVRIVDEMMLDGDLTAGVPVLVAGRHRLAAAKSLGWSHIDCIEIEDDEIAAELWELAENLHRLDLTKEQRDEHIRRYAELLEAKALTARTDCPASLADGRKAGPQHIPGIASQIADETGLSQRTVRRALNPPPPRAEPPKEVIDVHEQARRRLMSAWNAATEADRQWFRDWIDTPVMDRSFAA